MSTLGSYQADAFEIEDIVNTYYAYLDRFDHERMPMSDTLRSEAESVSDRQSLNHYAERAFLVLADHHAQIQTSFRDSWAVPPSQADVWVTFKNGSCVVDAVRSKSPAHNAKITAGDHITHVDGVAISEAIADFWSDLGFVFSDPEHLSFAARLLVAGRRDTPRQLRLKTEDGSKDISLASSNNWQDIGQPISAKLTSANEVALTIKFHNALGDDATIVAFDDAMKGASVNQSVVLDLTDTPSGGNTSVARAIMGWFAKEPTFYQMHRYVAEERATGVARQWVEQVLPRADKYHSGAVTVRVGRWTGSMGEGLALGLRALGAKVEGHRMAGLRGAIHNYPLSYSGIVLNLPAERLYAVDGMPREDFTLDT